ncbi:MAG: DUF481 domain-containing protein [Planctomycetota bacterium]
MFRICAGAAATGVWLGAGVAMASADAGLSVRERLLDVSGTGADVGGGGSFESSNRWFDPEFRPDTVVAAAPPAAGVEGAAVAVAGAAAEQPEGPNPNENAAAAEQAGPEAPPKPSIVRSIIADWKGELRFGFELASGNNDRTRFRGGFNINKKYWGHETRLFTEYIVANNNAGESENRLVSRFRQNWSTGGTKWNSVFVQVDGDADRFQDYDYRIAVSTGPNYQWVKNDKTNIRFNLAASVRREFGGGDEDFVPEGAIFLIGEHRFTDTQKVGFRIDYRPEIEQPSSFRLDSRANWDIDIAPEAGLGLRLSAQNRYDARPSRRPERNDFDMSIDLFWRF